MDRELDETTNPGEDVAATLKENQRLRRRVLELEQANARLVTLYVAAHRLHGCLRREEVILALQEIIANLVGSEEFAVYELDAAGALVELVARGDEPTRGQHPPSASGLIGITARTGVSYRRSAGPEPSIVSEQRLTACEPLVLDGVVTGVIVIFGLLAHKPRLTPVDEELLGFLRTHAAMALHASAAREHHVLVATS